MKKILLAAFASLLPSTALGGTFVVDIQLAPGADFQEVQEALDSPLVADGDTLLIRPGSYVRVITDKSVSMRGLGATAGEVNFFGDFFSNSIFEDCAGPMRFSNLEFRGVYFEDCLEAVHLLDIELTYLNISGGSSVRVENESLSETEYFSAAVATGSRVEFLHCNLRGTTNSGLGNGARIADGSYARFADCNITGANGSDADFVWSEAGDGSTGLDVANGSRVQLVGKAGNAIRGGTGGWGDTALTDGYGGVGLAVDPSCTVRVSNYDVIGGWTPEHTFQSPNYYGDRASLTTPVLSDPLLTRTGSFAPGATSTFSMLGDPGAMAVAFLGTTVISAPLPGIAGALATHYGGPFFAGQLDGMGGLNFNINMPTSVPIGALATMQSGMVYLSDGSARLSNPTTIWVQ